ncbi:MAG: aminopeptidase [Sphaerochaetaceae bacterium]
MDISSNYIDFLLKIALQVEKGESLTINVNKEHVEFATELAHRSAELTFHTTNIVIIEKGKVDSVIPIAPLTEELKSTPKSSLLLRIDDTENRFQRLSDNEQEITKELSLIQECGNLASPQLNRPIAPWAVVAVPGPLWAKRVYKNENKVIQLWNDFGKILSLNNEGWHSWWINYLSKREETLFHLNNLLNSTYHIKGENIDFKCKTAKEALWSNHQYKIDNRFYTPYIPIERYSTLLDSSSTEGVISLKSSFLLFNSEVENCHLELKGGKVRAYSATKGETALRLALSYDEGSSTASELSLVDRKVPLASYNQEFGYSGFDTNRRSTLLIGCGETSHLKSLKSYTDEKELQSETGCNISTIKFRVPLDLNIDVFAIDSEGSEIPIMHNGDLLT